MTQELVAGIIAFDSKEKELATNKEENEEDKEPAPTAVEMRKMLKPLERGLEHSGCCDVTNFRVTAEQVREHLQKTFPPRQATLDKYFKTFV